MNKSNKMALFIGIGFLVLLTYVFYPTTAVVSTEGMDLITPDEVGKTVEVDNVVATVRGPRAVNINDNVTLSYTVTNKRSDTIFVEDIMVEHRWVSLGALNPGENRTFIKSFPIRNADDGVSRYEGDDYENSHLRVLYPFIIRGGRLDFNNANEKWLGAVYFGDLRYGTSWCVFNESFSYFWERMISFFLDF